MSSEARKHTVVVTECDHDAFAEELAVADARDITLRFANAATDAELVERCADADGILVQYAAITADVMDALPHLKAIGRYGVGVDSVDVAAATARGIAVCNVPDYGTEAVSDHAIAMALAVARGVTRLDRAVRRGEVDLSAVRPLRLLGGRTFGVLGAGRIGAAVARKARGLGFEVIGFDERANPGETFNGVQIVARDDLFARADVLSVHVPLDESTRGIVNQKRLASMPPGAIVVNTARGGVIDTPALVAALDAGHLGGAAIDCHDVEPLPVDHPLTRFENVVLSPHFAWYSEESYGELKRRTMENVVTVLEGGQPRNILNPEVLGPKATEEDAR